MSVRKQLGMFENFIFSIWLKTTVMFAKICYVVRDAECWQNIMSTFYVRWKAPGYV